MGNNQTARRRWWHSQQSRANEPESVAPVSDEIVSEEAEAEQVTVGSMTQEELSQLISDIVERSLEELLPKQLARQRIMMETELKWHLDELLKGAVVSGNAGAANVAVKEPEPEPAPKINPAIDWSFLE